MMRRTYKIVLRPAVAVQLFQYTDDGFDALETLCIGECGLRDDFFDLPERLKTAQFHQLRWILLQRGKGNLHGILRKKFRKKFLIKCFFYECCHISHL